MVYFGKVQNGKIIPEAGARLSEGSTVRIEQVEAANGSSAPNVPDPADDLSAEAVDTGRTDMAEQHDHYARGTTKRRESR